MYGGRIFCRLGANSTRRLEVESGGGAWLGGVRLSVQLPKRRMVWVTWGEMVARSSVSTGWPSAVRALAASVRSQAVAAAPGHEPG